MKWFYDMKIGRKLMAAFIITGMITAVVGYVGVVNLGKMADMLASSYARETLGISCLKQANIDLIHMDRAVKNLLLSSTAADREHWQERQRTPRQAPLEGRRQHQPRRQTRQARQGIRALLAVAQSRRGPAPPAPRLLRMHEESKKNERQRNYRDPPVPHLPPGQ